MATIVIEDRFGQVPSSPGNGTPFTLFACHDTEGGVGRIGALGTLQFLHDTAAKRNASYHELWAWDAPVLTVIRIVPPNRAAHSVAPQPFTPEGKPLYQPTPFVREKLGVNAGDPNQGVYAVAIAGKVADMDRLSTDRDFLAAASERFAELKGRFGVRFRAEHAQFNPRTRSDWGRRLMSALGGPEISEVPVVAQDQQFIDVPRTHPFHGDIQWLIDNGISGGTGGGKFEPDRPVTRGELGAFLRRLASRLKANP